MNEDDRESLQREMNDLISKTSSAHDMTNDRSRRSDDPTKVQSWMSVDHLKDVREVKYRKRSDFEYNIIFREGHRPRGCH